MRIVASTVVLSVGLIAFGGAFLSSQLTAQSDLAGIVEERQELMKTMGKSFGPLVAIVKDESTDLNAAEAAAQTMHDSMVKAMTLFPAGSAAGEVPGSRAKQEVWTEAAEFKAAADLLIAETGKLVEAAQSGDIETFKAQFGPTGKSCGGCHEGRGSEGGKFRTPRES